MAGYQKLLVWQKAMELTTQIYKIANKLPKIESYALSNQMRRAAISIPSNIAEGQDRNTTKEFINFLAMARGSKAELETQLQICIKVGYLTEDEVMPAIETLVEVGKMLSALITKLRTKTDSSLNSDN